MFISTSNLRIKIWFTFVWFFYCLNKFLNRKNKNISFSLFLPMKFYALFVKILPILKQFKASKTFNHNYKLCFNILKCFYTFFDHRSLFKLKNKFLIDSNKIQLICNFALNLFSHLAIVGIKKRAHLSKENYFSSIKFKKNKNSFHSLCLRLW